MGRFGGAPIAILALPMHRSAVALLPLLALGLPNPPLCKADGSAVQVRAKSYPAVRELQLAQALGDRALVGSICAADATTRYAIFHDALAVKIKGSLAP